MRFHPFYQTVRTYAIIFFSAALLVRCAEAPSSIEPSFEGHSVVLISIDTCRADYIEPFGNQSKTPYIKALAEEGVWFSEAVTTAPLTVPAHASLFSGLYPIEVGMRDNFSSTLSSGVITIAELFQTAGYTTAGFIGAILLSSNWGFHQGFTVYDDVFSTVEYESGEHTVERKGEFVSQKAIRWIDQYVNDNVILKEESKPFFLFLHYYDPHMTYAPPEPFHTEFENNLYAGEIAYTDYCIGQVMDRLKKHGLYDETIIALVGDHGEMLGEHGETSHGLFLYESAMRIPLVIKPPKSAALKNRESRQYACITDIVPTLIDMTQIANLENTAASGISLLPWIWKDEDTVTRNILMETQYPTVYNWSPLFAVRTPNWKWIKAPASELYHLTHDPNESDNRIKEEEALSMQLMQDLEDLLLLASLKLSIQPSDIIADERKEQLAALGYVSGSDSTDSNGNHSLPDPKDKIAVHVQFEKGVSLIAKQEWDQAESVFKQLALDDPTNPSVFHHLAEVYGEKHEWENARIAEQKAVNISPNNHTYQLQMAWILIQLQQYEESNTLLLRVLGEKPNTVEAHFLLAVTAFQLQHYQQAASYLIRAKRLAPNYPGLEELASQLKRVMQNESKQ